MSHRDVSDRFNISISCLFSKIRRFIYFLSNLSSELIKWPDIAERNEIEAGFRENGLAGAIGAVDGCHVRIDKPGDDPDSSENHIILFRCRWCVTDSLGSETSSLVFLGLYMIAVYLEVLLYPEVCKKSAVIFTS